tara:strand:+ start:2124 stop:2822 length:699 start_codon:yes stop_codon:yes gene_type:complete
MSSLYKLESRFEDKFLLKNENTTESLKFILNKNNIFQAHENNEINNIYFDTFNYKSYNEHIEGSLDRSKIRVRWYTNSNYKKNEFYLEYKKRINKKSIKIKIQLEISNLYELSPYSLSSKLNYLLFDHGIKERYRLIQPVLFNKYNRAYYINQESENRITLDTNIHFAKTDNSFKPKNFINSRLNLVEHKYETSKQKIRLINNNLINLKRSNFSKYIYGYKFLNKKFVDQVY